ncbi:YCF48-related protein [Flavobacterium tegetincola]|uniref:YCF48-related protein n=1 Tax=Flavobacterium tegetincola TaxID=150172 RepID=UPI0003F5C196|nr:YCF48-related protein [Flavobacterium tegetincola]
MKRILLILGILCWGFTFSQTNWEIVNSGTINKLNDIQFTSNYIGYVVGENGTILKTLDGGNSWSDISITTNEFINSISFINDNIGYLSTQNRIYKTIDGGINWTIKTEDLVNNFNTIKFLTEQIGFIGTDSNIFKTTNGSQNWINIKTTLSNINTISFPTSNTGFFTGGSSSGYVYKTTDQGSTIGTIINPYNTIREEIQFLDNNIGYLIGWYNPYILKTTNGGTSWFEINMDYAGGMAVHFLTEQIGYHIDNSGGNSKIFGTNDGGLNWNNELTFASSSSYGLKKFVSNSTSVLCIGDNGIIYKKSLTLSNYSFATNNNIKIYPNPTANIINVEEINKEGTLTNYIIYNLIGQEIVKGKINNNQIDLQYISDGAYILKLGDKNQTFKIIKEQ